MSFFSELKRRNVFKVAVAYAVAAWLLLQITDLVLENINAPDWVMQVFMLAMAVGFPLAIIVAWAYEITPDGVKLEKHVDRSKSTTTQTGKQLNRGIIVILSVAVVFLLTERFREQTGLQKQIPEARLPTETVYPEHKPVSATRAKSIAVLPFVNMSADPDNEYFSDGIAEEILNVLARIPELKVAARTSAFAYKGNNINIAGIARDLNVDHVLEGSVRKAGDHVRITAQLIKADDGHHLWSATFDRELTNIFAIQDEIATSIAEALKVTLELDSGAAGNLTGTNNTEAYDAYLRGVNQWHLRTGESLFNSISLFEKAIGIDPGFARAHAGLALTYAVIMDYTEMPITEAHSKAKRAADIALSIDPALVEAATALIYTTNDLNQQLEYSRQAIALNSSFATAHQWYATTLALTGDLKAAEKEYRAALELDPRSRVTNVNLAFNYMMSAQWQEAGSILQQVLSWAPDYDSALEYVFQIKLAKGDRSGALAAGNRLVKALNRNENNVNIYLDMVFEPSKRAAVIEKIFSWPQTDWWAAENPRILRESSLLVILAMLGEFDRARVLLQNSIENSGIYRYGNFRIDRSIPEFVCDPETRAMLAATELPPLKIPYPCEELLK